MNNLQVLSKLTQSPLVRKFTKDKVAKERFRKFIYNLGTHSGVMTICQLTFHQLTFCRLTIHFPTFQTCFKEVTHRQ